MIIIGEKINGAIPSIKQAIAEKNEALIIERTLAQAAAGANFLKQNSDIFIFTPLYKIFPMLSSS